MGKNIGVGIPKNYYKEDNPEKEIVVSWYSHAQLLYTNWLNYYVYQTTPYDLSLLPSANGSLESPAAPKRKN